MSEFDDNLYQEHLPNVCAALAVKAKKCCTVNSVKSVTPIISWLPEYKINFLPDDFVAGLTVGLTTIPQAIAYAVIAGLSPEYGLYSAFMGCFIYMIFGTSKDITVGPTAIMSLMVQVHVNGNPDYAVLSCFLSGCVILLMGILNLGVLVQFISVPVTIGFTAAAAITIASGQINNLFGIQSSTNEFIPSWVNFCSHIKETRRNDAILGVCSLIFLLLMKQITSIPSKRKAILKYISLSRNVLAVIIGIVLCYCLSHDNWMPFRVNGKITPGLPPFKPPPFNTIEAGEYISFGQMASNLGASLATIPLISILESIAVAKAFSKGKIIDATQEMIALGLCNILSSFVSSMPITGSFTRTAINNSSGVKTQLGGLVTGTLVLMALAFLTKTFYFIPKATLAAIIIAAMIFMIEYEKIAEVYRSKKMDMLPFMVTVLCCLFWSLEYGMVCGIVVNSIFILQRSSRPRIDLTTHKTDGIVVGLIEVHENLSYSAAEYLKAKVIKFIKTQEESISIIVIKGEEINHIDSTVALNILSLKEDLSLLNCEIICWNWKSSAAGVICRSDRHAQDMFKFGKSLNEVVLALNSESNGATIVF